MASNKTLQAAGIPRLYAPTVGIAVDHRRQNLSEESLAANVERLKEYMSRLIVFPRKSNKPKKGDATAEDIKSAKTVSKIGTLVPKAAGFSEVAKADAPKTVEGGAYRKLRVARSDFRQQGAREKRAKDKAEAEAAKK
jgi:large subunit ribosomal protein L13e